MGEWKKRRKERRWSEKAKWMGRRMERQRKMCGRRIGMEKWAEIGSRREGNELEYKEKEGRVERGNGEGKEEEREEEKEKEVMKWMSDGYVQQKGRLPERGKGENILRRFRKCRTEGKVISGEDEKGRK